MAEDFKKQGAHSWSKTGNETADYIDGIIQDYVSWFIVPSIDRYSSVFARMADVGGLFVLLWRYITSYYGSVVLDTLRTNLVVY